MTRSILLSQPQARSGLARELISLGVRVVHWPELSIDKAQDNFALDEAIDNLFGYDWLILKTAAAVQFFLNRFERSHSIDELDDLKILAIGEKTQQVLSQTQIHVDVMIDRSSQMLTALEAYTGDISGLNLIVPSANIGRATLELQLEQAGARVDCVLAYRTCSSPDELFKLKALIQGGAIDSVAFKHASSVEEFASLFDTDDLQQVLAGVAIACLEDSASKTARGYGLTDLLVPPEPTFSALARYILE